MRKPIEVPTQESMAFVVSHLLAGASVLEVGCGAGHVASELSRLGYGVTGLDSDPDMIAQAEARGVVTVLTSWPAFDSAPFDAVAFNRSLHHIHPLRPAIRKGRALLQAAGILLLEDFAFDEMDEVTVRWFLSIIESPLGEALINPVPGALVTELIGARDPVVTWHRDHDHALHSMASMTQAIAEEFVIRATQRVPYLYRYLVPVLPETSQAAAFVAGVFQEEARLGQRGEITLIGRRLVASPQGSSAISLP